jgi:serpin B
LGAFSTKAYVDIRKEGTEAAAAAPVKLRVTGLGQIPVFRANHLFSFSIRDNHSGSILFIGRAMNRSA